MQERQSIIQLRSIYYFYHYYYHYYGTIVLGFFSLNVFFFFLARARVCLLLADFHLRTSTLWLMFWRQNYTYTNTHNMNI